MKEMIETTEELKKEAHGNVKLFDLTKMCFKNIFELMNNSGVFVKTFSELLAFNVVDKKQIKLTSFNYNYVEESDGRVYPSVDLFLSVSYPEVSYDAKFCLTLTPFNASLNNAEKSAGVYGGCDRQLSKTWRIVMKGFFKKNYVEAFKQYCADSRILKECAITMEAEKRHLENNQFYEEEINSI